MKGISLDELREKLLNTPEAIQAYQDADRELAQSDPPAEEQERAGN